MGFRTQISPLFNLYLVYFKIPTFLVWKIWIQSVSFIIFNHGFNIITSQNGYKKTLRFLAGIFIGFFALMILCTYFNLMLFSIMPKVRIFMSFLGAGYMLYLAIKIMKLHRANVGSDSKPVKKDFEVNSFYGGMTLQFVNPKVILYGITVISNFVIPNYQSNIAYIFFALFLATVALASTSCWAIFGSLFNQFLSKYQKQFNVTMGLLLIYSRSQSLASPTCSTKNPLNPRQGPISGPCFYHLRFIPYYPNYALRSIHFNQITILYLLSGISNSADTRNPVFTSYNGTVLQYASHL